MKHYLSYAAATLLLFPFSCKKNTSAISQEDYQITVLEYKTNLPLPGVQVKLIKCTNYDNEFGCQATGVFTSKTTNSAGIVSFTNGEINKANEGIILHKSGYWDKEAGGGTNYLESEASLRIHLRQGHKYPDTAFFALKATSELSKVTDVLFKAPKDSTIIFKGFGNEDNPLEYFVYRNAPVCYYYCFADSVGGGKLTRYIDKAQVDTLTIVY